MKTLTTIAATLLLGTCAYAQNDFGLEGLRSADILLTEVPEISAEAAIPAEGTPKAAGLERAAQKEWTVMVFLNAKNNLESYGMKDMNEMETVGSTSKVNVVVQMGRMAGFDDSDGDWRGVRRYYVTRDLNPWRITSPVVQDLGRVNMGDSRELTKFVQWAKANYPAKQYLLVLWNHGSGWDKGNPVRDENKGISFDDETGNNIDTPQLRRVLAAAGGVDVLASDACLMQMAEVAYEVKDGARFIVGSEETEPGAGYAYYKVLFPLSINPTMSAESLGRVIVAAYWDSNPIGFSVATHSILDGSRVAELGRRMDEFARAAMASGEKAKIKEARDAAQKYAVDDNKDLHHFASLVAAKTGDAELRAKARALATHISGELVLLNMTSILPRSNSNGIAAYIPGSWYDRDFNELRLARDTQWDEFLQWVAAR